MNLTTLIKERDEMFDNNLSKSIEEMFDYGAETKDFHRKIKSIYTESIKLAYEQGRKDASEEVLGMCKEMKYDANMGMCKEKDFVIDFSDLRDNLTNKI